MGTRGRGNKRTKRCGLGKTRPTKLGRSPKWIQCTPNDPKKLNVKIQWNAPALAKAGQRAEPRAVKERAKRTTITEGLGFAFFSGC